MTCSRQKRSVNIFIWKTVLASALMPGIAGPLFLCGAL